jgi:uncharacterized protein (TIGR02452 family)
MAYDDTKTIFISDTASAPAAAPVGAADVAAAAEETAGYFTVLRNRIAVWKETVAIDEAVQFPCAPSNKLAYDPLYVCPKTHDGTYVYVKSQDTLDAAYECLENGLYPLVLNFADDLDAGGCVDGGSGAQEESLFRRTNLYRTLLQSMYPIQEVEAVYSPCVTVFRAPEDRGHALLDTPFQVSIVSAPALKYPNVQGGRLRDADVLRLKKKIRLLFQTASANGHDALVLGAWGCGAWRNPPIHVAHVFREMMREFSGVMHTVVFACLDTDGDHYQERPSNYSIFTRVLLEEE